MALEALEQVCVESSAGAAPKTRALAFALAFLWSKSDGQRWPYDEFWQVVTGPPQSYVEWSRSREATRCLSGVYLTLGRYRSVDIANKFDSLYKGHKSDGMCNHYRNNPELMAELQTWREYIGWSLDKLPVVETDIWPKRQGLVIRNADGAQIVDTMQWGVPLTMKGKREGTTVTKRITNVRNLQSSFWRSMLESPAQRCLVPFTSFAEPKIGQGRENTGSASLRALWRHLQAFGGNRMKGLFMPS